MKKQKLTGKGMTIVSEALLSVGIILVAVAFVFVGGSIVNFQSGGLFSSAQNQMTNEIGSVIRSLPDSSGSFSSTYEAEVASYTLTVQENSVVSVEIPGQSTSSSSFAGLRLENTRISDSEALCISKRGSNVSITAGGCDDSSMSNFCANGRCINGECQVDMGETCSNSGGDCTCGSDSACETGYKAEDYIDASGSGDDELDTNEKGCVLPRFVGSQDSEGDQCDYNFECSTGMACNTATSSSGVSGSYCCPTGERWDGSSCVNANVFDVVFVPMDYPDSEISSFQTESENSFEYFRDSVSPFKSCSDPSAHTKAYYADNANGVCDISSSCDWGGPGNSYLGNEPRSSWQGCWAEMRDCANQVYGSEDWDMVVGMNKGNGFSWGGLAKWFDVGAAIVDDIPEPDTDQTTAHEIGHTLNLRHVEPDDGNICPSGGACQLPNHNPSSGIGDCSAPPDLSERRNFIMSYCSSLDRFGPEGYEHMEQNSLQPYLWGSC